MVFKGLWTALGLAMVALGLIGAALPLMPTTVFLLLALYCFARGSPRLHQWLLEHPRFGPSLRDWRDHGAMSRRAKRRAIGLMAATFALCWALGLSALFLSVQALAMAGVATFLATRPEPPERGDVKPERGDGKPERSDEKDERAD